MHNSKKTNRSSSHREEPEMWQAVPDDAPDEEDRITVIGWEEVQERKANKDDAPF